MQSADVSFYFLIILGEKKSIILCFCHLFCFIIVIINFTRMKCKEFYFALLKKKQNVQNALKMPREIIVIEQKAEWSHLSPTYICFLQFIWNCSSIADTLNGIFYPLVFWFSHVTGVHLQLSMYT